MLSPNAISFHYVSPAEMFFIDFLLSLQQVESNDLNFCKK